MADTFTCDLCKGTFTKGWSNEASDAEMEQLWGDLPEEDRATICDDCFGPFMAWAKEQGYVKE